MDKVKVNKKDLISILKTNRDEHGKKYNEALLGYIMMVETELKKKLKKVRSGEEFDLNFYHLQKPECHVENYNDAIGMLEVSVDEYISISMEDYLKYYKDKWEWHTHWTSQNSGYLMHYTNSKVTKK
jgi:hypothetical protein